MRVRTRRSREGCRRAWQTRGCARARARAFSGGTVFSSLSTFAVICRATCASAPPPAWTSKEGKAHMHQGQTGDFRQTRGHCVPGRVPARHAQSRHRPTRLRDACNPAPVLPRARVLQFATNMTLDCDVVHPFGDRGTRRASRSAMLNFIQRGTFGGRKRSTAHEKLRVH
jgi:hypothetical protein